MSPEAASSSVVHAVSKTVRLFAFLPRPLHHRCVKEELDGDRCGQILVQMEVKVVQVTHHAASVYR